MVSHRVAVLTSSLLFACGGAEPSEPTPEPSTPAASTPATLTPPDPKPPSIPTGQLVRVRDGAALLSAAEPRSVAGTLPEADPGDRARVDGSGLGSPPSGIVMEVVDDRGEFVHVQSLASASGERAELCGARPELESAAQIEGWVERSALIQVVGKPVEIERGEGTRLTLHPGVSVGPKQASGQRVVDVGVGLAVVLDEADLGLHWQPMPLPSRDGASAWAPTRVGTFADGVTLLAAPDFLQLALSEPSKPGEPKRVTVANACGTFTVRVDAAFELENAARHANDGGQLVALFDDSESTGNDEEDVWGRLADGDPSGLGLAGLSSARTDRGCRPQAKLYTVAAGAALTWPGGERAGTLGPALELETAPTEQDERLCFPLPDLSWPVCVGEAAVTSTAAVNCDDRRSRAP